MSSPWAATRTFYLVVEGPLDEGDPDRCRAVLTHELKPQEVQCRAGSGKTEPATRVLQSSDNAPPEVTYHGCQYTFSRCTTGYYKSAARSGPRITWDYERSGRNLAVERWPEHRIMAVYEGQVLPIRALSFIKSYQQSAQTKAAAGTTVGLVIGGIMMFIGYILLII